MGEAKGVRCCEGSHIAYNLLEEFFSSSNIKPTIRMAKKSKDYE
jgi:hypothetical protein